MNGQYRDRVWVNYSTNIVAANTNSAVFLASFLSYLGISKDYVSALEVIDLQKYKIIKKQAKVRIALTERMKIPFVFIVGKN